MSLAKIFVKFLVYLYFIYMKENLFVIQMR